MQNNNPFSFIEQTKLSFEGYNQAEEISYEEMQEAIKKRMDEKQIEIDDQDSIDDSNNECGDTEKVMKQGSKNLCEYIRPRT